MTEAPPAPAFFTPGEVADMLRTSRPAIYAMIARRQLPGVTRVNRRVLVERQPLLDWLRERRAPSL